MIALRHCSTGAWCRIRRCGVEGRGFFQATDGSNTRNHCSRLLGWSGVRSKRHADPLIFKLLRRPVANRREAAFSGSGVFEERQGSICDIDKGLARMWLSSTLSVVATLPWPGCPGEFIEPRNASFPEAR